MLEERAYSKEELAVILGTSDTQGMKRKLETHKIDFTTTGRGKSLVFNLVKIQDPFRVLCITDLGFAPNTDFKKLRNFMYYFMNDDDFRWLPDEVLEVRMREMGEDKGVSRQTIGKWKAKLSAMDIVNPSGEYTYYFAYAHRQILTDKETYCTSTPKSSHSAPIASPKTYHSSRSKEQAIIIAVGHAIPPTPAGPSRYVESFLKMFYLIFGQAYSRGYLDRETYDRFCTNKDTKIKMPKLKRDDDMDIVIFTQEELNKLDKAAFKTLAEFVLSTGANVTASLITGKIQGLF